MRMQIGAGGRWPVPLVGLTVGNTELAVIVWNSRRGRSLKSRTGDIFHLAHAPERTEKDWRRRPDLNRGIEILPISQGWLRC